MKPQKPPIKKVSVDAHIRKSERKNPDSAPRRRGRPRKNPSLVGDGINDAAERNRDPSPGALSDGDFASDKLGSVSSDAASAPKVVPEYDTTEEARAIIQAPFSAVASLTGISHLALTVPELEALMPSWKVVYDKRIAPFMGENADLYTFGFVMANVCLTKFRIYQHLKPKSPPPSPTPAQAGPNAPAGAQAGPSIPVDLVLTQ